MSRVAKMPVALPINVQMSVENNSITIQGPKGTLHHHKHKLVLVTEKDDRSIHFEPVNTDPEAWAQAGTLRAQVNNMVKGVTTGFEKTLELVGVGYRAQATGKDITLSLGYSHPIEYILPEGVSAEFPNNTTVLLKSIDKHLLGQVAAEVRAFRPPEPYKGKGVKYAGEVIVRKETKKK
jgi:large subunit ribosomal protein L6